MQRYNHYITFREDLETGKTTCIAEVRHFLSKIEANSHLNAFLETYNDDALEQASLVDEKIANGTAGKLAGMIIALKDNICYKGHHLSGSSKILEGFESLYSSTATDRLLEQDAIIIGRTNCDEFAMGSSNENSAYGPVKNPLNENLVPGGSSGGSAAAVSAGLCHAALGSDTGGSIRQPASFCGVIGLRPTYGRISRHGLMAFASSFDQIGTITNTMEDAALIMEVISGKDFYDATVSSRPVPDYSKMLVQDDTYKLVYLDECVNHPGVDPEIKSRFDEILNSLKASGIENEMASFPYLDQVIPVYYVLATAEASSNLSRYSGMTYGHRTSETGSLEDIIIKSRSEGFGPEVKRRIMLGTFVLSEGYYDAYYNKAQKVRRLITDHTNALLQDNDFLILPTAPTTAFALGENTEDPIAMYLADIFTIQSAIAGLPSISLPLGWHSNGMPFGLQIIGRSFEEDRLFAFSKYLMDKFSRVEA